MSLQVNFNTFRLNVTKCCGPLGAAGAENSAENALRRRRTPKSADKFKQLKDNYLEIQVPNALTTPNATSRMRFYRTNPPLLQSKNLVSKSTCQVAAPNQHPAPEADSFLPAPPTASRYNEK